MNIIFLLLFLKGLCYLSLAYDCDWSHIVLPTCVPQLRLLSIKQTKVLSHFASHITIILLFFLNKSLFWWVLFCQVRDVSASAQLYCLQTPNLEDTAVKENNLEQLASQPSLSSLSLVGIPIQNINKAVRRARRASCVNKKHSYLSLMQYKIHLLI